MQITISKLKKIIDEELDSVVKEGYPSATNDHPGPFGPDDYLLRKHKEKEETQRDHGMGLRTTAAERSDADYLLNNLEEAYNILDQMPKEFLPDQEVEFGMSGDEYEATSSVKVEVSEALLRLRNALDIFTVLHEK
tara:strand:+ start:578 stop:985 length:408 start_codon:yes stop_codon:yes gene_type:complete